MRKRSDFIALMVVTILFSYAVSIGTTFNGVLTPDFHNLTLGIIAITVGGWLFLHWQRGWVWHRTPLDGVFVLWVATFAISLLANLENWRRIAIGLWYISAYIGFWYLLADVICNKGLKREILVDGLLICGIVVLIFGFFQARDWLLRTLPLITSGLLSFSLPRPVSTLGNPNALANFLVVLIPFILVRVVSARSWIPRIMMGIYAFLAIFLLFLTYSRGSWLGIAAGVLVWGLLVLAQHKLSSPKAMLAWLRTQNVAVRLVAAGVSLVVIVGVLGGLLIFMRSFSEGGRGTGLRTSIYGHAITLFTEKPITGSGLFTFGQGLARLESVPPITPHSHAHNTVLHIAAEFGLIGLVTLFATLVVMFLVARRNWRTMDDRGKATLAGAIGAVVAFAVHELTDIPATTPAVALVGLVALALMMIPLDPVPLSSTFRRLGHPVALAGLWVVLLATGFWSSQQYSQYVAVLWGAIYNGNFRESAAQMQTIIDADPALTLYDKEQGFLLGLAASEGDLDAARDGINVYQRFIDREPGYAIVWANMAALQWQLGEREAGLESMRRAVQLAPESWQLAVNLGNYETEFGNTEAANAAYDLALRYYPDTRLMPGQEALASRPPLPNPETEMSIPGQIVQLLDNGEIEAARQLWANNLQNRSTVKYIIDEILALSAGDRAAAEAALNNAGQVVVTRMDEAWTAVGSARLARFDGDDSQADEQLDIAREKLTKGLFEGDFADGLSVAYAQFLRLGFPRQFIPQVYYPTSDPVLMHLLETT